MATNNRKSFTEILRERIFNQKFRKNLLQALPFWCASVLTGLVAVGYTKLFAYTESLLHLMIHDRAWLLFILSPAGFIIAWFLVKKFDEKAVSSGIPQVIAAIELANPKHNALVDKFLSVKMIFVKITSSVFMILGGGIVGREGPTVQIAAGIFRKIDQLIPDSWPRVSKRNMIISGAAAGLAAAFNTPLGGIVFAVEELAKSHISQFKTAIFTCVIIAGITAQAILGPYLYLGYPNVTGAPGYLFIFVALVAAIAGILSSFTNVAILKILKWKRTFTKMSYHLLYAAAVALILACIAYFFNMGIIGSGKAEMSRVLFTADKHVAFAFPFLKIIGTIACFTSGGAGGIFAPALGIGATLGTTIAELFHFTSSDANILILSGMVAFLTGITRSPFTSAILVLEMTDSQSVIFHLMLAGIISSLVSLLVDKHSLYEHIKGHLLAEVHKENSIGKDRKQLPPQAAPQNG